MNDSRLYIAKVIGPCVAYIPIYAKSLKAAKRFINNSTAWHKDGGLPSIIEDVKDLIVKDVYQAVEIKDCIPFDGDENCWETKFPHDMNEMSVCRAFFWHVYGQVMVDAFRTPDLKSEQLTDIFFEAIFEHERKCKRIFLDEVRKARTSQHQKEKAA